MAYRTALAHTPQMLRSLFRALHQADPTTRRAFCLLAAGATLQQVQERLGLPADVLRARLERLASGLDSHAA